MADSLSVSITANSAELRAQLALAQAELKQYGAEVQQIAAMTASASATGRASIMPFLTESSAAYEASRAKVMGLRASLGDLGGSVGVGAHGIREFSAAAREMAQGDFSRLPTTFALLAGSVGQFGLAGVGAVAGVAALGAGLAELVLHLEAVREAGERASAALALQGIAESGAQIKAWLDQVGEIPGVSTKAAGAYVQAIGAIRFGSDALKSELIDLVPVIQKQFGEEAPKELQKLADAFNDLKGKGAGVLEGFGAAPATMEKFYAALVAGDRAAAFEVLLGQIVAALKSTDAAFDQSAVTEKGFWTRLTEGFALGTAATDVAGNSLAKLSAALASFDDAKIKKIADDMAAATAGTTTAPKMAVSDSGFKAQLDRLRDDTQRSQADILRSEVAAYGGRIAELAKFGQETTGLEGERLSLIAQLNRAVGSDLVEQARLQASQIGALTGISTAQRLEQEASTWARVLQSDKLTFDQRVAAQRSYAEATAALNRQTQTDQQAISRDQAKTEIEIAKLNVSAEKSALDQGVAQYRITAAEKAAILRDLANQEYALDLKAVEDQQKNDQQGTAEFARAENQKRVLAAQLKNDIAAIDRQQVTDSAREAEEQARNWRETYASIGEGVKTFINDSLSGNMTIGSAAEQAASRMLKNWIAALAEMALQFAAFEIATLAGWAKIAAAIGNPFGAGAGGAGGVIGAIVGSIFGAGGASATAEETGILATGAMPLIDSGSWGIASTGSAIVHQGEIVVPPGLSSAVRSGDASIGAPGAPGAPGTGSGVTLAPNFNVTALDAKGVITLLRSPPILRALTTIMQQVLVNSPSLRGAY
jgi:hypothetical protein